MPRAMSGPHHTPRTQDMLLELKETQTDILLCVGVCPWFHISQTVEATASVGRAQGSLRASHATPTRWPWDSWRESNCQFPSTAVHCFVLFFLFNCLWTCSCFHQPGIQRRLEVKLLQEHWFDSSFLPTTYLKTKGCQSPLFKTVTSKGREEGGRDLSCLCLFSIVNWQLNDSISGVGAHPYLAYPPLSWASESESYLNTPSFFHCPSLFLLPSPNQNVQEQSSLHSRTSDAKTMTILPKKKAKMVITRMIWFHQHSRHFKHSLPQKPGIPR